MLPAELFEWCQVLKDTQNSPDFPAYTLVGIVGRFIDLHASITKQHLADPALIIERALQCETEMQTWESELPDTWRYNLMPATTEVEDNCFGTEYQMYGDMWTVRIWNHYRWARILIHELILTRISLDPSSSLESKEQCRKQSIETISVMAKDICESVACQFIPRTFSMLTAPTIPYMAGVFLLLFPLAVAGGAIGVSENMFDFVIKLLGKIGNTMGVQQALTLITITKKHHKRMQSNSGIHLDFAMRF